MLMMIMAILWGRGLSFSLKTFSEIFIITITIIIIIIIIIIITIIIIKKLKADLCTYFSLPLVSILYTFVCCDLVDVLIR